MSRSVELTPLSRQSAFIANIELRETPTRTRESTTALRALLRARKDIYFRDDNDFLLRFLRPTKFYPESALQLMVNIAKLKKKYHRYLDNLAPKDEINTLRDHDSLNIVLERDNSGRRIIIIKVGEGWRPSQLRPRQILRALYMVHVAAMLEPETQVKGIVVVLDLAGLHTSQLWALLGAHSAYLLDFLQKAMPLRLKEIHIINHPTSFTTLFPLCRPFVCSKLYKRIFLHGNDLESLHRYVDPSRLPEDFGGSLAKMEFMNHNWHSLLLEVEETIREWCTFGFVGEQRR